MRIKDFTDTIRHLTDPFNIPEARRMIQENPALTQEQFKVGGLVEPGVVNYAKKDFISPADINPKDIERLWDTHSVQEIADKLGASKVSVERVARKSGITGKTRSKGVTRTAALNEATEFFAPGKKWKDFSGKERSTIYRQITDSADRIQETGQKFKQDGLSWDEFKIKFTGDKARNTRLQWIADNGANYDNPNKFIKAYEKNFGHKLGSKADVLFHVPKGEIGKNIYLGNVKGLENPAKQKADMLYFKKGFSEEEIFKGSIIQNNKKVQKQLKKLFANIDYNLDDYVDLGPESIVKKLKKQGGELFGADKGFDWIKATTHGTRDIGGVHRGIVRNSLLRIEIPEAHLKSFQEVRQPLRAIEEILESIKERPNEVANRWGVGQSTAVKIGSQLENFLAGRGEVDSIIKSIDYQLKKAGGRQLNEIFGGVNFEHTLAKRFGQDYKYLPRNYLLKGQFTSQKFNIIKRDEFDKPLMEMMKKYTKNPTTAMANKIQNHIKKFNAATNNYADFSFDPKKGKLVYPKGQKVMYDLSRYADKGTATKELVNSIQLGQTKEFQKAYAKNPLTGSLSKKSVQSFIKSTEGKKLGTQARNFIEAIGCPGKAAGGRASFADGSTCYSRGLEKVKAGNIKTPGERANFRKLAKTAGGLKGIARMTGLGLAWEAAFAPVMAAWMMPGGESPARILNELAYGLPIVGETEKDELKRHMGETGFNVSELRNLSGDRESLQMELNEEINRSGGREGKSYKQYQIEQQIKKLDEKLIPLVGHFYEGPAGQYFGEEKWGSGEEAEVKGLESLEQSKADWIKKYQDLGLVAKPGWKKHFRTHRMGGGIMGLKK